MKELDIIGVQMDLGASKRGVAMGPMAIRYGGLREGLESMGFSVHDRGDIVPPEAGESRPGMRYYDQVVDVNRLLKQFEMMQSLTKQFSGGKMSKNMRRMMSGKKGGRGFGGFPF